MEKVQEKYMIKDGLVQPSETEFELPEGKGIYIFEVIRVISGIPLFLDEHLQRLQLSIFKSDFNFRINREGLETDIYKLINSNQVRIGNLKIVIRLADKNINTWLYFIPYSYPSPEEYLSGVELGILHAERLNPEAKTIQPKVRETASQFFRTESDYEVLLIDQNGFIREGSRSNVFFIKGDKVYTPPADQVLNGITRCKVIDILETGCCEFEEVPVLLDDLKSFDGIFITGTSPKVLSVKQAGSVVFNPQHPVYLEILKRYDQLINGYISKHL